MISIKATLLSLSLIALHIPMQALQSMNQITEFPSNCFFCQQAHNKDVVPVAQFEHCFVLKDNFPVSPGHMLIVPYHHIDNWFAANETVQRDIIQAVNAMKEIIDVEYHPDGYNIGMNCGQAAGQTVMHLHVHLIPRYIGDVENPRGGVRGVIPTKQKY